jgi:hypothetical protein
MKLSELQTKIHQDNVARGWWEDVALPLRVENKAERAVAIEKLCLIHSEVSEALEEVRGGKPFDQVVVDMTSNKPTGFPTELADTVIRILDLAEACGFDIESVIMLKLEYNRTRGHRHGGKLL